MARSLNKVILIGNLGRDPEYRVFTSGTPQCTFSLATTESYKDKNGTWQEETEWHKVVIWRDLAETASKFLKKGSKVCIEGKNKTRTYEKDGNTYYVTEVVADRLIFLDKIEQEKTEVDNESKNDTEDEDDIPF